MAAETGIALKFLWQTLGGDTTLLSYATGGVFRGAAPQGTTPPWVIFEYHAGSDTLNATAWRLLTDDLYQVKVVGPDNPDTNTYAALVNAADRVDALLMPGGQALRNVAVTGGGTVIACYRDGQIDQQETVEGSSYGTVWRNIGGFYRILI